MIIILNFEQILMNVMREYTHVMRELCVQTQRVASAVPVDQAFRGMDSNVKVG